MILGASRVWDVGYLGELGFRVLGLRVYGRDDKELFVGHSDGLLSVWG